MGKKETQGESNKSIINWFPGHMAKARREIQEKIKLIDIVIELVDARAPISSRNPMISEITNQKPRLVIMTKIDMADDKITKKWIQYYEEHNIRAIAVNLKTFNEYNKVISICRDILSDKIAREAAKGLKPRPVRAMVMGIPNVGKSTFINRLAKRKATITGNKPGVTKSQQIIKINNDFELFDTPGVLWPKLDDQKTSINIALIGSIKQQILPLDELFIYAIEYLEKNYSGLLTNRYNIEIDLDDEWIEKCFSDIAANRKIKEVRGYVDYDRVIDVFFTDLFNGNLGKITWELPNE